MADIDITLALLSKFGLNNLSQEWVKSSWDSDFTDIGSLDLNVESDLEENDYHIASLQSLVDVTDSWISHKEGADGEGFWTILVENDISYKDLIALLAYIVDKGYKKSSSAVLKEAAILSGSNYIKLLTVPGSGAFKVFHPVLYEKCIDLLKLWAVLGAGSSKRKRSSVSPSQSQSKKRSKGNKSKKSSQKEASLDIDEDFEGSVEDEEEELAPQETTKLRSLIINFLKDLVQMLEVTSLRQSESSSYHTVQILATLTRHDTEAFDGSFDNFKDRDPEELSLCGLAYKGIYLLCLPLHGHVGTIVTATCKYLLPNLLMLIGDNKVAAQTVPKPVQLAREHAISFIIYLMKTEPRSVSVVRTLIQHMCTKVTDRAEYRLKVAQAVVSLLQELPSDAYGKMVEWFYKLSKHSKINNRAFVLEIVSLLLNCPEKVVGAETPEEIASYVKHSSLLGLLLGRCSDIAPTVRARAITAFSQCFLTKDQGIRLTLQNIVTPAAGPRPANAIHLLPTPELEKRTQQLRDESHGDTSTERTVGNAPPTPSEQTPANQQAPPPAKTPFCNIPITPFNPSLPDGEGVLSMFRRRASDEKVNVRKAAIQAIEAVIRFEAPDYRRQDLEVLVERCRDPSLSVRKQALQSLTDILLDMPAEKTLQQSWLDGVLPLVIDRETTLQEKCLDTLEEIIVHNVVPLNRSKDDGHKLVWDILEIMTKFESVELRRYLQKACRHWARQGKIKPALISALQTHINTDHNEGAWMLLAEIAPAAPKISHGFVYEYWQKEAETAEESSYCTLQRVLTVMSCSAKYFPPDTRDKLITNLSDRLKKFDSPPELISVTINTLSKLCEAKAEATGQATEKEAWCSDLLHASDKFLSKAILEQDGGIKESEEDLIVRHLFTLGEIAQLCPAKTPKRVFLIVQSMIAAPCITSLPASQTIQQTQAFVESQGKPLHTSTDSTGSSGHNESKDSDHVHSSQSSGTQCTQPLSQFHGTNKMSSRVRAFAFITLGKLCLQNPDLAKKCVAALARELETSPDPTIRNNVVIIMCDLCVRYTTTADRYVSNIAACLKDPSSLVRKQTLTLITRLLQEDFLKWRGNLFFRFITTLLDSDNDIASFAQFCLVDLLLQRHPTMFFQHFMECIFHFNAYEDHKAYNKFTQNDREKKMFSLKGKQNMSQRKKLYTFMLENMTDEHRFHLTAKICTEILGGISDDLIPLNDRSAALLQDALAILSCKEIKLSSLRAKPNEEIAADEQEMAAVVMATAKKTLITQVVKKNVMENIVPIVVSLKHKLEKNRSPLLQDLMLYLRELMRDYKNEVKEILSADKQLATEIEFDLRKFEESQAEAERQKNKSPVVRSHGVSPASSREGTPRQVTPVSTSPHVGGTPRGQQPVGQSPRLAALSPNVGSPGRGISRSPHPVPQSPAVFRGTPLNAKDTSISTLAILNSARKAFQLQEEARRSPTGKVKDTKTKRKSYLAREEKETESETDTPEVGVRFAEEIEEEIVAKVTTPKANRRANRAISTPSDALENITFHIDQNMTFVPPSPIPGTVRKIRYSTDTSEQTDILSQSGAGEQGKENSRNIIYMMSPDKPQPKPRKWNVKTSSLRRDLANESVSEDVLEEDASEPPPKETAQAVGRVNTRRSGGGATVQGEGKTSKRTSARRGRKK